MLYCLSKTSWRRLCLSSLFGFSSVYIDYKTRVSVPKNRIDSNFLGKMKLGIRGLMIKFIISQSPVELHTTIEGILRFLVAALFFIEMCEVFDVAVLNVV